ncbi:DoxX family protein [Aestuariivirga sp.]|uniref:DoxX family protein n=1 Tax=Aestuariivirga sp. TaxID=2650926 RepID=UPI00359389C2
MTRLIDALLNLLAKIPHSIIGLIGRLSIGLVFWNSGRTKVDGWNIFHVNDKTLFLFQNEYKVPLLPPELAALSAQVAEHVLPVLLFVGLATRFSALGLLIMTLVIEIFVYPGAYVLHGTWAAVLLMLIKYGPGKLSLDHLIYRR